MSDEILALPARALAFTAASSFTQFLTSVPALAPLLRRRLQEIHLRREDQDFFSQYPDFLNGIILLNEDMPETVAVVPVLLRVAQVCPRLTLHLLHETENLSALARLVDDFELSELDLPQLFLFDEEWNLQGQWGPHPQEAEPYLDDWFAGHPNYDALAESDAPADQAHYLRLIQQLTHEMRVWYNSGLNQAAAAELRTLFTSLQDDDSDGFEDER